MSVPSRLVDGGLAWGRLEVSNEGRWGTVCDNGWDRRDGQVRWGGRQCVIASSFNEAYSTSICNKITIKEVIDRVLGVLS